MTLSPLIYARSSSQALSGSLLRTPTAAWAALLFNVLAYLGNSILPMPHAMGQAIAQGSLPAAVVLALLANRGVVVRFNGYLLLLSLLAVVALMVSIHSVFVIGSTYRAVRLVGFVMVLWLLTPWWGRAEMPLLRAHVLFLRWLLGSVIVGLLISPGQAHTDEGRLQGIVWPIPPTQVAHYAAILLGCTLVLWMSSMVSGRATMITAGVTVFALLESHTRTALAGLLVGLVVAGASLFLGHARVRRTAAVATAVAVLSGTLFSSIILNWLSRGQTAQEASQFTGRAKVWDQIWALDRTWVETWFGSGLSNKSFAGLPIDSNWVATYLDLGWFGVGLDVLILLTLIFVAVSRPRGARRALSLFLITYCAVASFTETGLGDASPYLLDLAIAASLLAPAPRARRATAN